MKQANIASDSGKLHSLFAREWDRTLSDYPLFASSLGDRRLNRFWPDESLANIHRRDQRNRGVLSELQTIDPGSLSPEDQLNLELFRRNYKALVDDYEIGAPLLPVNTREGIQDAASVGDAILFEREEDYEDWIARIRSFPTYLDQSIDLLREGTRQGIVHARCAMQRLPPQIQRQIVRTPEQSSFYKPFQRISANITPKTRQRLMNEAARGITELIVPAYEKMLRFFEEEYLPACTEHPGAWQWPEGEKRYAAYARKFTTTDYTPAQIHQMGLTEVARIREQMEQLVRDLNFSGSWNEFLEVLRTDPRFYFESPEALTAAYQNFCTSVDKKLGPLFRRLPRIPYDIQPIPSNIAPDTTTAYYRPPSADGKRAGTYFINLYRPEVRPRYEIPALSLHEAVPGHHLQIARAMELQDLPAFRRFAPEGTFTGYVEGWALYAESLGEELGCYEDPYDKFGQFTYEIWRAARLVVDTGIHVYQWSRERAIDYLLENTGKVRLDIENEVDRYISWPGQSLAYKVGEIEIQRLRRISKESIGSGFDLRDFHETILSSGPLPLDLLDHRIKAWISGCN